MAANVDAQPHVQVRFFTKQHRYSVPNTPYSLPSETGSKDLNSLINSLLDKGEDGSEKQEIVFDFLISGDYIRETLQDCIAVNEITTEQIVDVEYVEKFPAPEPKDSLLHDDWIAAVRALDDFILTGSYDNSVRLWNTAGDLISTIPAHVAPVKCLSWIKKDDKDDKLLFVSGSHDETLLMWEWDGKQNAAECAHHCRGHAGSVDCVAVDPSKTKFCSGSWDKMIKVWSAVPNPNEDAETSESSVKKRKKESSKAPTRVPMMTLSGHQEGVSGLVWLSDDHFCSASWDHTMLLWDLNTGEHYSTLTGNKVFLDVAYSPLNQTLIAASADRHLRLYDPRIADGAVVKCTFTSHTAWVSSVAWSPVDEHYFISGGYDCVTKIWDTRSSKAPLYNMTGHEDKVLCADWSNPGYILSGGADNHLKIFTSHMSHFDNSNNDAS